MPNQVTAIDFTPRYAKIMFDGIPSESLYLQSGPDHKIFLHSASGWTANGDSSALHLKSATMGQAQIDLRAATFKLPEKFDEKWRDDIKTRLLKAVPKDAVNAEWIDEKVQPLAINSWRTYESRVSYELFGNKYVWGVCWIEVSGTYTLEMSSNRHINEYPAVRQSGMRLMASWLRPPPAALAKLMR